MFIQVPLTATEFTTIMMQTQEDNTHPQSLTTFGLAGLYSHFQNLEREHNTQIHIDPLMLNATWSEYATIGEFKRRNFKVGSKTFESISEVRSFTTIVEVEESSIILVASVEDHDRFVKDTYGYDPQEEES